MPKPVSREQQHFVAHAAVDAHQRLKAAGSTRSILLMQITGRTRPFSAVDQQAVDQVRLQPRFGGAGNDQQLVDVGHQHVLPPADRRGR